MRAALRKVAGEGAVGAGGTRAVGAGGARAAGAGGARAVGALGLLVVALVVGVVAWPSGAGGPTPDPHVVRVMAEQNLVLVRGAVPGANGSLVMIRKSVKTTRAQQRAAAERK